MAGFPSYMSALSDNMLRNPAKCIIMQKEIKSKLIQEYLELMPAITPASAELMQTATLRDIRPSSLSQAELAKALGRGRTAIGQWERGLELNGINSRDILKMARLFNRRAEEVLAAIENTRLLTEEETN